MRAFGVSSVHIDDDEDMARMVAYNEYIADIKPALPARVRALLEVSVHDARVTNWKLGSDRVAELTFITENVVENVSLITLRFSDASAVANDADDVATLRLLDGHTDLISSEFDIQSDGSYRYQILVDPTGELAVTFSDVYIERAPATMDDYVRLIDRPNTGRWGRWADAWLADEPALHKAAALGHVEEVRRLIASGHSVNEVDPDTGRTPLHAAASRVQVGTMTALLAAGADIDRLDNLGISPLGVAAGDQSDDGVELLIRAGADVNAGLNDTPVSEAAIFGNIHSLKRLIAAGADPNHRDDDGWTVLMHAVDGGRVDSVEVLLGAGADPTARASDGHSVLDIARSRKSAEVLALLPTE